MSKRNMYCMYIKFVDLEIKKKMIRQCKCLGDDKNKLGFNIFIKWCTLLWLCTLHPPPTHTHTPQRMGGGDS